MSVLQQAIFTSSRTERMDGYQLVSASDGITPAQKEELCAWGPAHDSLLSPQSRVGSVNFHQLRNDAYCISKTVPAGSEYSGRNGPRVYTTCLLIQPDDFRTFANQPFRVLDAAIATGCMRVVRRFTDSLPVVRLRGRASSTLVALLEPLTNSEERQKVIALASAVCHGNVLVQSDDNLRPIFDRMFNVLPVECRPSVTFSTGLSPSPQRPVRLQPAADESPTGTRTRSEAAALTINLDSPPQDPLSGWWAAVDELLERGAVTELSALLSQTNEEFALDTLDHWSEPITT